MSKRNKPVRTYLDAATGNKEKYEQDKRIWVRYNLMKKIYNDRISKESDCMVGRLEKRFLYIGKTKATCYGKKLRLYVDRGLLKKLTLKPMGLDDFWEMAKSSISISDYQEQVESKHTYALCSCHYRIFMLHNPWGEICIHNGRVNYPDHYGMSLSAQVALYEPFRNCEGFPKLLKKYFPQHKQYCNFIDRCGFCAECGLTAHQAFNMVEAHYDLLFFPYRNSIFNADAHYKWRGKNKTAFA